MMLRATVVDVTPRDPTRVWVTIPQKYGTKPVRVFTRVEVSKGDHVYVSNTSVTRVPQWVVFGQQSEIGRWGNPYPHTHPMGQVAGLMDWVSQYETWTKDHQARLDAADKQIADGKLVVTQARKDLDQAQTDIAEAVRKATLEQARLDQAEANLDQMGRNLTAAGGRISANEAALTSAQNRLTSAETTVQKTSGDLTTLQGTVGDVRAKAEAADQRSTDALTKAGAAQTSADGKNRITRATTPASQPGTAEGDTHFTMSSMGGGGVVTRQQRWDGSTWQDETVGHQVLASLDLGKATVGELDGGRIRVGSISADRVMIGLGQNLVANPSGGRGIPEPHTAYYGGVKTGIADSTGGTVFYTNLTMGGWGDALVVKSGATTANGRVGDFVLDPRSQYVLRLRMKKVSGTGQGRVKINVYDINGSLLRNAFSPTVPMTTSWANLEVRLSGADVAGGVSAGIVVQNPRDGEYWYEQLDFRELGTGELFVDGSITGKQIEAHSVAGAIGQFLKLEAQSGTFTDSLTGRNARLLGETVAESINITGKLRGRDAILSGTVDIGQLNVTGEMSAKIISTATLQARQGFFTDGLTAQDAALLGTTVAEKLVVTDAFSARVVNAMTAQTKQLVVTEDAILNRATVVQSLVTPELIASKVDARYLRADNIKTGLLEVFGRFRTAPDGQPQIIIQPSQAAWNSKDLAIWFTPDGTTPGGGDAMMYAVTGGMWMNPAGGGGRSESLWTAQQLNLRGQSRAGVRIMDGLTLQSTAGTVGPTISTPNGQFLNIIGNSGVSLTTLGGPANIRPYGDVNLQSNDGGIYMTTARARGIALTPGDAGVVFLDQSGSPGYNHTASQAANMYIHSSGKIYRSTSSRRYKKYISDYTFDVTRLRDVRLRKWRDRKQAGQDEDLNYYYGAIAEEIYELYPEHVPMIADPTWDGDGPAPMIPDSIAYDRLALGAAVAGWQNTDRRLTQAAELIQSLEQRVAQLEGASS